MTTIFLNLPETGLGPIIRYAKNKNDTGSRSKRSDWTTSRRAVANSWTEREGDSAISKEFT